MTTLQTLEGNMGAKRLLIALFLLVGLILAVVPPFLSTYLQSLLVKILIFTIFAMSLDLLMGYADLPSLGHAAYFGTAGYTAAI
ncbi:MAG: branched-chain amino acid ABC transporter permease, partial [Pseudomonadota bacterium]